MSSTQKLRNEIVDLQQDLFGGYRCQHNQNMESEVDQFLRDIMDQCSLQNPQQNFKFKSTDEWTGQRRIDSVDETMSGTGSKEDGLMPHRMHISKETELKQRLHDLEHNFEQLLNITATQQRKINQYQTKYKKPKTLKGHSRKLSHTKKSMNTLDHDAVSDISDITYRSKSCFRRDCCVEKDKIMTNLKKKNVKKATKIRQSSVIGGGGGPHNHNTVSHFGGFINDR